MRLDLLQSHGWQVSLGRFAVLLVVAFVPELSLWLPAALKS